MMNHHQRPENPQNLENLVSICDVIIYDVTKHDARSGGINIFDVCSMLAPSKLLLLNALGCISYQSNTG